MKKKENIREGENGARYLPLVGGRINKRVTYLALMIPLSDFLMNSRI